MTTNDPTAEKRTAVRPRYFVLGTDADGRDHLFCTADRSVHVVGDGARERIERLDRRPIGDWMAFVGERLGWLNRRYYAGTANWLANTIAIED